jgi:diguanylate cyclase (GGDEF)-like protein
MNGWFTSKAVEPSVQSWGRVILLTIAGTLCCVVLAFTIDSYSFKEGVWRLGTSPENDVIIPLLIAPPFFFYLLSKLRQLAIAHKQLTVIASTDGLTSCFNRAAFTTLVDAYLERVNQQERRCDGALLVMDVDHFKNVNDNFGHDAGDEALKLIAQSIRSTLREVDLVGRMGGEEFSVFLPGIALDRAVVVAERIRETVKAAEFCFEGVSCDLSISIGGATFVQRTSFSELYKLADKQLYDAKRKGRNRVELCQLASSAPLSAAH